MRRGLARCSGVFRAARAAALVGAGAAGLPCLATSSRRGTLGHPRDAALLSPQMHAFKSFLVKPFNISEAPYTVSDTAMKNWNNAVFRLFGYFFLKEKLWMTCL